ncbi:hypothetical protein AMECASPLE_026891 [Ameca splendens]|uniref:Ig-like domain-containing protein n=1 Tax=Ameca splendens TaxID=208324 RepID=A0ABV0Z2Y3_9TELE
MITLAPRLKTLFRSCLVLGHIFMSLKGLRQMRGAAMSLPPALSGPVLILLSASVVLGQRALGVIYTQTQICAVEGGAVDISCSPTFTSVVFLKQISVKNSLWFSKGGVGGPVDLMSDPDYIGRVQYFCDPPLCTLRITDLRESDSAEYKFSLRKYQVESSTGSPGVKLSVTALQVKVLLSEYTDSYCRAELKCQSSCQPDHQSYIWIKNGHELLRETSSSVSLSVYPADRYSCALKGYEAFISPSVYAPQLPHVSVSPSGQLVEGRSVTLTCSSDANPAANYTWYKEEEQKTVMNHS